MRKVAGDIYSENRENLDSDLPHFAPTDDKLSLEVGI